MREQEKEIKRKQARKRERKRKRKRDKKEKKGKEREESKYEAGVRDIEKARESERDIDLKKKIMNSLHFPRIRTAAPPVYR